MEAAHLVDLLAQFRDLLSQSLAERADAAPADEAVARLVPDAYADDPAASRDFRAVTGHDLLQRRDDDAQRVSAALAGMVPTSLDDDDEALQVRVVTLSTEDVEAWLRTLTALRLVLASRLHITSEEDHSDDDPRYGVYEWLGYRLEGLVQAADDAGV